MIYRLAIQTGMREGEIMALKWPKIDFEGRYLRVDTTLSSAPGKLHFDTPKTANSVRNIYLSSTCLRWLQEWRQHQDNFAEKYKGIFENKHDLVFTNIAGNILSPSNFLHRCFTPVLKKANILSATFHTLRHTHASQLLARGVNVQVVAERLGHASVTTTIDVYAHLLPGLQDTAKEALEAIGNGGGENDEEGNGVNA